MRKRGGILKNLIPKKYPKYVFQTHIFQLKHNIITHPRRSKGLVMHINLEKNRQQLVVTDGPFKTTSLTPNFCDTTDDTIFVACQ